MPKQSAGILFYRYMEKTMQVMLVHPGGPFWAKKDTGAWSIPKGEFLENEEPLMAALREVEEETGIKAEGNFIELEPAKQKSGKTVFAWALEMDFNPKKIKSNSFEMEWPPRSGKMSSFPEIDKAAWFNIEDAASYITEGQRTLLTQLNDLVGKL